MTTMASTPYMNQVASMETQFVAKDEVGTDLRIDKTSRGWTVTVEPSIDYPATFHMNFDTKAALIAWLTESE
jgi:hypothetical protein